MAYPMLLPLQFGAQLTDTFAGPAQWRFWISARGGFQQTLQVQFQRRVLYCRLLAPTPLSPNPAGSQRARIFQLSHALPNHWAREASYSRNCRNSASADRLALRSCHQTSRALIQNRSQRLIARLDPRRIDHCVKYTPKTLFYGNVISRQILSQPMVLVCDILKPV